MALLDVAVKLAARRTALGVPTRVVALHVHHGLSPHADEWWQHVAVTCERWSSQGAPVEFLGRRLTDAPAAGDSVEAWARLQRYRALAEMAQAQGCQVVWLAHHRRDQAETVLLQALRGAGVAGLAAMPAQVVREAVVWARPWLHLPRELIEAHVAAHSLSHVDDESNGDARWARNRVRQQVWPALVHAFPDAELSLASVAQRQADALACLQLWARSMLPLVTEPAEAGLALHVPRWRCQPEPAQRELLRAWFLQVAGQALPASWVLRLPADWANALDGRWPIRLSPPGALPVHGELRLYRGLLTWTEVGASCAAGTGDAGGDLSLGLLAEPVSAGCLGEGNWAVPGFSATLRVRLAAAGEWGVPEAWLPELQWRPRCGGERFSMGAGRPARCLKKQFQAAGVAAWCRSAPLLWRGETLVLVPGLGVNAFALRNNEPVCRLAWVTDPGASPVSV